MDALEDDYRTLLLGNHEPPCLSLYQPTHRVYPDKQQDPIRFDNLVKKLELSLTKKYAGRDVAPLLRPFHELAQDAAFWRVTFDGIAAFAKPGMFRVYRLQRPVPELAVAADSFHTKPLMRILQSADRYHVLGLTREEAILFEGNRYALDQVELPAGFPRTASEVVGEREGEPERLSRAHGPAGQGRPRHGTDSRQDLIESETERFFRAVDEAVLERYSQPSGMPLLLATLPEHQSMFREISRNRYLMETAIDVHPSSLTTDELRERSWELVLPLYLERLEGLIDRFNASRAKELAGADLAEVARSVAAHRVDTLLIDADRVIPGRFDPQTGAIEFAPLDTPDVDDLLDDIGEHTIRTGGEVVIVPAERMPADTGVAAIYRF